MTRYLLDPQGGDGNGPSAPPVDLAVMLRTLLAEKGDDAKAVARELLAKNRELEADNRKYRKTIKELRESKPTTDAVVLVADDARRWAEYRELGEPADVKASSALLKSSKV